MIRKSSHFPFSFSEFQSPSSEFSPVFSWSFNSPLTKELVDQQLEEFLQAGIHATYLLSEPPEFRPDSMATEMSPSYLSEEFFELIRYTIEAAAKKGIDLWLYDEGGWPSGSACFRVINALPETAAKHIVHETVTLQPGETFSPAPDTLAIFNGQYELLESPFHATSETLLHVYSARVCSDFEPHLFDEKPVEKFLELTHEGYRKHMGDLFGKSVFAIFTDEPKIFAPFYLEDVSDFERRSGYCFRQMLPALLDDVLGEAGRRFKVDYIEYCAERFTKTYFKRIHEWCQENNLLFTGHLDKEHELGHLENGGTVLENLRQMDIPGVDVIWRQIYPGNPDMNFFPRLASSAAHQTGATHSVSESFGVYGHGLNFDIMRYVCNYQFVRGITHINVQSIPSGRERYLASNGHYIPEAPDWDYLPTFTRYLSRMQYLASVGTSYCDIALYLPERDSWVENTDSVQSFYRLGKEMEEHQLSFDLVDDRYLCSAEISDGTLGSARYKAIFLPKTRYIKPETVEKLSQFLAQGGKVYALDPSAFPHFSPYSPAVLDSYRLIECDNPNIRVNKRMADSQTLYLLFNESVKTQSCRVRFPESAPYAYRIDALHGTLHPLIPDTPIVLVCGEECAVLFSDTPFQTVSEPKLGEFIGTVSMHSCRQTVSVTFRDGHYVKELVDREISTWDPAFSGSAVYHGTFEAPAGQPLILDLGNVRYFCQVTVNGHSLGQCIMPPYRFVVDGSLVQSHNQIDITVTNTPANAFSAVPPEELPARIFSHYIDRIRVFDRDAILSGLMDPIALYTVLPD